MKVCVVYSVFFLFLSYSIHFFGVAEFYFVRHGQTDFNSGKQKKYKNMFMNKQGKQEIEFLKGFIDGLSIEVIYFSPLKRTAQTKDILNDVLQVPEICLPEIKEIRTKYLSSKNKLDKISKGFFKVLSDPRLALVVGHGNIYKAICNILGVQTNIKKIETGSLVHFYKVSDDDWTVEMVANVAKNLL
jgi:phosphohistidine phosphatase SixA